MIAKESETDIIRQILTTLKRLNIGKFVRINNNAVYNKKIDAYIKPRGVLSNKGISDILGWYAGKGYAIEAKTWDEYRWVMKFEEKIKNGEWFRMLNAASPKEIHAMEQINFLNEVKRQGGVAFFSYSADHTLQKIKEQNAIR